MHSTDDLNDGYLGSGKRLCRSVNKHGKDAHIRETLFEFATREEASEYEKQIITQEMLEDPNCLNCGPGGLGATDRPATSEETRKKLSEASKKYVRTREWYEKAVATRYANGNYVNSPETREKIRQALTGKTLTEEHKKKISEGGTGQKRSEETRQNISKALKGKTPSVSKAPFSEEHKEAIRQGRIGKKHSEEAKQNMRKSKDLSKNKKACTVDGITIYQSVGDMVKALGAGKKGRRSPDFRFLFVV